MDEVTYRAAYKSEWDICMDLAWRTFLKFDAPDYPQEGIDNFREFVTDEVLKNMFHSGEYQLFVPKRSSVSSHSATEIIYRFCSLNLSFTDRE